MIDRFDICKTERNGDCYMCLSGAPKRNGDSHADQIGSAMLDLLQTVMTTQLRYALHPEKPLRIRVGCHTGAVIVAVMVGNSGLPRFCLLGDTGQYLILILSCMKKAVVSD